MASTKANMKGFYRQKKKDAGISKPDSKNKRKSPPLKAAAVASDLQLINEEDKHEDVLRRFDLNLTYGPCLGMSRLARWERAHRLGMNPPADVETLLKTGEAQGECVWNGRV